MDRLHNIVKRFIKLREISDLNYIYKNELEKVCFALDTLYSASKDLVKRTIPDTILKNKTYEIAINPKYDRYQRGLASMVYKFFLIRKQD